MTSARHGRLAQGHVMTRGARQVRLAGADDLDAILDLRARVFRQGAADGDAFDAGSLHLWVGCVGQGPDATLRLRHHKGGADLLTGYAAQHYDLTGLAALPGHSLELGRLCTEPGRGDADLMRAVWAGVARLALETGAARLIGCTSFHTADPGVLAPALRLLRSRHLGPAEVRPGPSAPRTHAFPPGDPGPEAATLLPPLLRAYLAMGGWVSDHLVIDRDLGTCHVFTCVEIVTMPAARRRVLLALAADI